MAHRRYKSAYMSEFLTSAIDDAFRAHGIQSALAGSWVNVGDSLRIRASTQVRTTAPDSVTIQLDVITESPTLGSAGPIVDSFAGLGATQLDAERNAFEKFLRGSFHVVAESLTAHKCDSEQVEWEQWKGHSGAWKVCSGPLLTQATVECKTQSQYGEVLHKIQDEFLHNAKPGPHWLSVFVGFLKGEIIGSEVLLDGKTWNTGISILRQAAWMPSEDYESIRHLLVALPASEVTTTPVPIPHHEAEPWPKRLGRVAAWWRREQKQ